MLLPFPPAVRGGGGTVADDVLDYQGSRLVSPEVDPNTANLQGGLDQHAAELGQISLRQKETRSRDELDSRLTSDLSAVTQLESKGFL